MVKENLINENSKQTCKCMFIKLSRRDLVQQHLQEVGGSVVK
jgi:hypothetical protein